jgi:hypothetical protein
VQLAAVGVAEPVVAGFRLKTVQTRGLIRREPDHPSGGSLIRENRRRLRQS